MKAIMCHAGNHHPRQEVVATGQDELLDLIETEREEDPETTFWIQDVPEEAKKGSRYYPTGFHHSGLPEWIY